jgi:hypothetical protein
MVRYILFSIFFLQQNNLHVKNAIDESGKFIKCKGTGHQKSETAVRIFKT